MRKLINRLLLRFYRPSRLKVELEDTNVTVVCWGPCVLSSIKKDAEMVALQFSRELLGKQLKDALAAEDYEQAAKIRDKMKPSH
jgi:hypothetical protein